MKNGSTHDPAEGVVRLTGGEALVRTLEALGIPYVFGMGGFQLLPMYRAFADSPSVKHVLIHDERAGAFIADGYARVSGRIASSDGTLGPGATNLITGLAESFGAAVPQLAITGDTNSAISGRGATQESRQVEMIRPTVKESLTINALERVPELTRRAVAIATSGRPGPVHLNVPEHIAHGVHAYSASDFVHSPDASQFPASRVRPARHAVEEASRLLSSARRPLLLVGGGIHLSRAWSELVKIAESFTLPVATSISGKGAIAETHELSLGVVGRFSRGGNDYLATADVVMVVGCKLGEIVTNRWTAIPSTARLIHVDIDPAVLGTIYRTDVSINADAVAALQDLAEGLRRHADWPGEAAPWATEVTKSMHAHRENGREIDASRDLSPGGPIDQGRLMLDLSEQLPPESILVADGGFAAHWSAIYYRTRRAGRHYIANRGHSSIGYGLPGAIGAKLAAPTTPVVALTGDAGFSMSLAELETALRVGANVICVVVNNQASGYVKALQHQLYGGHFQSVDYRDLPFAEIAKAMGARGQRVRSREEFSRALEEALSSDAPFVIDVMVTRDPARMLPGIDARTQVRSPG